MRQTFLFVFAALALTGCPPTGEPPAFGPSEAGLPGDPCTDTDGDGYVVGEGCRLPSGDCAPADTTRNPGAPETCNRLDDDCDRATDEGDPGGGVDCTTDRPGLCAAGRTACEQGELTCAQIEQAGLRELCNGIDDTCDGSTDEGDPGGGGACDTGQPGQCGAGTDHCVGGVLNCVTNRAAEPEACNGEDDDCDGTSDEGDPEGGGVCNTGLQGVCATGAQRCTGGRLQCATVTESGAETCNGLDDDCDGRTDETFPDLGSACSVGEGACARASVFVCAPDGRGVECDAAAGNDRPETCNGEDDDCDGTTDEDFPDLGVECQVGLGLCARPGALVCGEDGTGTTCAGQAGSPVDETCDGQDEDCDGATDETFPTLGTPCVDRAGQCVTPGLFVCGADHQSVRCSADPREPTPEVCNDIDDDCDGTTDEGFADKGAACESGLGLCARPGQRICAPDGASTTCNAAPGMPAVETCNGADDDCDGFADDATACPGPPTGEVNALRIAEFDEARCRDLDGDGTPDNAFGSLAGLFNQRLAAALAAGRRPLLVRAPGFPPPANQGLALEIIEGVRTDDGLIAAPRAIDAFGRARSAISGVRFANDAFATPNPGAPARVVSPLFFNQDEGLPFAAASYITLGVPAAAGPVQAMPEGLTLRDLVLTGAVDRQALLDAWQAASDACAAAAPPPADCDVFALVPPAVLAANLVADLDRDGRPGNEAVSVCLVLSSGPGTSLPLGGQPCDLDANCPLGLACRVAPVVDDARLGASLQARCGPPGPGSAAVGAACERDADCLNSQCLETTAEGPRCTRLCSDDAPCEAGLACRGVPVAPPGALTQGGRSAAVCVPTAGSGAPCTSTCANGEVCGAWLTGALAVPGGVVTTEGRCERANANGAALGGTCEDAFDCAHGGGCISDLQALPRCAPPCAHPGDCAAGTACVSRDRLPALAGQPALAQAYCLPVPPEVGSGTDCVADLDCAGGETCRVFGLPSGEAEQFCVFGDGFFTVGQPCTGPNDCASGRCQGGFCGGLCAHAGQCTPRLACDVDALPAGGDCVPATGACVADRDCAQDPACAGGRCVCDQRTCRIGCRFPGACPAGLYCQPDNTCAVYCRDDYAEPNDQPAQASLLDLGRRTPRIDRDAALCGTSAVDNYRLLATGFPFEIAAVVTGGDAGALLDLQLTDGLGHPVGTRRVDASANGRQITVAVNDPADARDLAGRPLLLTVRGSGIVEGLTYRLGAQVRFPVCADPASEPRDEPWEFDEILTRPDRNAAEVRQGAICPQDTDWFAVFLQNGDRLTLDLAVNGAPEEGVELDLLGPDHPREVSSRVVASIPAGAGGRVVFTPPNVSCNPQTNYCQLADGTQTEMYCAGQADLCFGMPWYVRIRGAGAFDQATYTLNAQVARNLALQCVPDVHEQDEIFDGDRIQAALGPTADAELELPNFVEPIATLPVGPTFSLNYRACGADGPAQEFSDFDSLQFALLRGERLRIEVRQSGAVEEMVYASYRFNPNSGSLDFIEALLIAQAVFTTDLVAQDDNIYGIRVVRPNNSVPGSPYSYSLPYTLTARRLPANFLADGACNTPTRVALANNRASVTGSTLAANDDHQPLLCAGGHGPDRAFVVRLPAGVGTLSARVEADGVTDNDPSISIRNNCASDNSEVACNEDDGLAPEPQRSALVEAELPGNRDVFVLVDSFDVEHSGPFRLTLEWRPQ